VAHKLIGVVSFTGIASGASSTIAHGLHNRGRAVVPDFASRNNTAFVITAVDDTNITVRNDGAEGDCAVLVEHWHSIDRSFGSKSITNLTPQPFIPGDGTVGANGGQAITYRFDGQVVDVYVDQINGDDANNGLTAGTALQTIDAVYQKFPWQMMGDGTQTVVNLINDSGSRITYITEQLWIGGANGSWFNSYVYRGPAMTLVSPATGPATVALDATPATRVDNAGAPSGTGRRTRLNFTTAAPGWTANDLAGSFVRITRAGTPVFYELPISQNDANNLYVDTLNIVGSLLSTDTVEIVEPGVLIRGNPAGVNFGDVTTMGMSSQFSGNWPSYDDGCTFERVSFLHLYASGCWGLQLDRCSIIGTFGSSIMGGSVSFVNCASKDQVALCCASAPGVTGRASGQIYTNPKVSLTVVKQTGHGGFPLIEIGAMNVNKGNPRGNAHFFVEHPLSVYGSSWSGIRVVGPSIFYENNVSIQGSGNGRVGIRCIYGGQARISGGVYTGITGGLGDLQVGVGAAINYGTGVGQFEEAAGWNGHFQRFPTAVGNLGDASIITARPLV
jgi:hypothetical protein